MSVTDIEGTTLSRLGIILARPVDRVAMLVVGLTAVVASIAEATVLVTITLLGLRLAGEEGVDVDLPFDVPFDELSNTRLIIAGFLLLGVRLVLVAANAWVASRLAESTMYRWRSRVVASYLSTSWERQQSEDEGHLQTVTQTYVSSVSTVVLQLAAALTAGASFVTFIVGAFVLHPLAALGLAAFGAVLFVAVRPLTSFVRRMSGHQKVAGQEYARLLGEMVAMPQETKVFGIEDAVAGQLEVSLGQFVAARRRQSFAQKMTPYIFQTLGLVIVFVGLAAATRFEFSDAALIGALVLLLIRSLNYGQTFQSTYQTVVASQPLVQGLFGAVAEYESCRPTRGEAVVDEFDEICFESVTLGYGDSTVLEDVNFTIRAGESIGVIGSSGSGKSTLAVALLGLLTPSRGELTVGGQSINEISPTSWTQLVAFVPQDPRLFDGTVGENIAFFREIEHDAAVQAASLANLGREMDQWGGLDHSVGPRGSRLSGGQRQRVCIARALAQSPSMLILDEPTSALDGESEESITDVLSGLQGRCTMFVIAHRLSTLEFCDRVLLVEDGRVTEIGSGVELQQRSDARELIERALASDGS